MKTKERENAIRESGHGKRDKERAYSDSRLLFPTYQEMKVHPAMLMKIKERENGIWDTTNGTRSAPMLTPDSSLLTSAFQKMKVHPEMLLKTKERENGTRSARILTPFS